MTFHLNTLFVSLIVIDLIMLNGPCISTDGLDNVRNRYHISNWSPGRPHYDETYDICYSKLFIENTSRGLCNVIWFMHHKAH